MVPARSQHRPLPSAGQQRDLFRFVRTAHYRTRFASPRRAARAGHNLPIRRQGPVGPEKQRLASEQELSLFLKGIEKRAFKRTVYAVRDEDAALDIVQDAMIRLAERYGDRPPEELPLVFQRILSNATMDWFRRQ